MGVKLSLVGDALKDFEAAQDALAAKLDELTSLQTECKVNITYPPAAQLYGSKANLMAVKVDKTGPAGQLYVAEGGWKADDKVLLPETLAANGQPGHESRERLRVAVRPADWRQPADWSLFADNCTKNFGFNGSEEVF